MRDDTEQEDAKTAEVPGGSFLAQPAGFPQPKGRTEATWGDLGEEYQQLGPEDCGKGQSDYGGWKIFCKY